MDKQTQNILFSDPTREEMVEEIGRLSYELNISEKRNKDLRQELANIRFEITDNWDIIIPALIKVNKVRAYQFIKKVFDIGLKETMDMINSRR